MILASLELSTVSTLIGYDTYSRIERQCTSEKIAAVALHERMREPSMNMMGDDGELKYIEARLIIHVRHLFASALLYVGFAPGRAPEKLVRSKVVSLLIYGLIYGLTLESKFAVYAMNQAAIL